VVAPEVALRAALVVVPQAAWGEAFQTPQPLPQVVPRPLIQFIVKRHSYVLVLVIAKH
jgi:hypothetical protein